MGFLPFNWIQLRTPSGRSLLRWISATDSGRYRPAILHIECTSDVAAPAPLSEEDLADGLQRVIDFVEDATDVSIQFDGRVLIRQPQQTALTEVGQLQIANFPNPEGLLKLGENLYQVTDASGRPASSTRTNAAL